MGRIRMLGMWPLLAVAAALALAAAGGSPAQTPEETHTLNFRNADIVAFIEDVSALTGYTLIVHPEVRGNVTVTSQARLSREQVFEVFLSTLRTYGYTAIPTSPGTYRIVPETAAAQSSGAVGTEEASTDEFVTQVFALEHFDAVEAARMVTPLVNHRGQVAASASDNMLIVVDYAGNIGRIREIIAELDQDRTITRTITLQYASAREVANVVNDLERGGVEGAVQRASARALEGTNAIVLRGEPAAVDHMEELVGELDVSSLPMDNLRVIPLRHARAADVVPVLEAVARTMARVPQDASQEVIPYDEATNSVVLAADPQTVAALVRVVEQLDVRRPQVQIEAIIVEISEGLARDLGVQYLIAGKNGNEIPFAASNYSRSGPNLLAITGALLLNDDDKDDVSDDLRNAAVGSLIGANGGIFGIGGENEDALFGVILTALQEDSDSNVLSTPYVTTLDNEPASILVGQEIPITTGEALGSDNLNPFRTIERKEIGVKLEVTPQISAGDTINLSIRQEVSSIFDAVDGEFITNKREIEAKVLADDGEIIVLGGLIDGTERLAESQLPVLGDVPLVGRLFSSTSRDRARTNLVVFIRASIVRDAAGAAALTARRMNGLSDAQAARSGAASDRFDELLRSALGDAYGAPE